jgi:GTP cyclohydrolase I
MPTLADTQSEPDARQLAIDRVGIKNLRYPVQVRDKALQNTIATVAMTVDLPHQRRGTHMSRFIEALQAHGQSLDGEGVRRILVELRKRLDAWRAHAEFEFPFFLQKPAPVTGAVGMMDYAVRFSATSAEDEPGDFMMTVIVPVTTLCPCSKAISQAGAHNQRGEVTCAVRLREPLWIEDLIRLVESCASCELYSLLKRPDEKAVTERAYARPAFVEDLVRDVALKAREHPAIAWCRVEAENFESIHHHNAYAMIESRPVGV